MIVIVHNCGTGHPFCANTTLCAVPYLLARTATHFFKVDIVAS